MHFDTIIEYGDSKYSGDVLGDKRHGFGSMEYNDGR
jgi:hypothetical protein